MISEIGKTIFEIGKTLSKKNRNKYLISSLVQYRKAL
jgi:hypothetical protein